ncbi:uncharacterized protein LOC111387761 [Olea europaea var. sylvestris]|uniref:uncharacterized protein LOC111387761 n=1 Tax=Olea europaea var. sylvestris TaxID=158386 RepID=UPI000C1D8B2A|nr:uncharacterized protein LOC111387761 [Olea europaea var. sylvestris]
MVLEEDPFAPEIMAVPLPKGFKQPIIEAYDGVTNPLDHLRTFVDLMRLYAAPNAIMCRSFPPTLRREARDWVATLFPSEKDESLQEYLARFNRATLGIEDLQMSTVVTALMNGTRNRAFKMSLSKNPPKSMHDLLKKGDKYVDAEEAEKFTKNLREGWEVESHKRKAGDELRPANKNRPRSEKIVKEAAQDRPARHKREESRAFTPLNTPRAKLLMEIRDMKELEWLRPMVTLASKRNQGRYCHFHKDHGHDTEECLQLKEEIERLLRQGLLTSMCRTTGGSKRWRVVLHLGPE